MITYSELMQTIMLIVALANLAVNIARFMQDNKKK